MTSLRRMPYVRWHVGRAAVPADGCSQCVSLGPPPPTAAAAATARARCPWLLGGTLPEGHACSPRCWPALPDASFRAAQAVSLAPSSVVVLTGVAAAAQKRGGWLRSLGGGRRPGMPAEQLVEINVLYDRLVLRDVQQMPGGYGSGGRARRAPSICPTERGRPAEGREDDQHDEAGRVRDGKINPDKTSYMEN